LWAGRGNDVIEGGAGADTIDGGPGSDTASYASSPSAVMVDLATGVTSGGDAQGDVLRNIENLQGSAFNDALTGDALGNVLSAGDGNDVLIGAGGSDLLEGGAGDDQLAGGDGDDKLQGGPGNDQLDGGPGLDTAYFSGLWSDYTITTAGDVTDVVGIDGSDRLTGIEFLNFQDRSVYVGGPNAAPTAVSFSKTVTQRGALPISQAEFLQGASDPDGDPLSLYSVSASPYGLVTLTSTHDVKFEVNPDFVGTTSFDFTISDGKLGGRRPRSR
jgi:Bacterial Ig domain/RTX calcium-binding nonapeptide repeat (4 copies)